MSKTNLSRRTVLGGALGISGVALLAACGQVQTTAAPEMEKVRGGAEGRGQRSAHGGAHAGLGRVDWATKPANCAGIPPWNSSGKSIPKVTLENHVGSTGNAACRRCWLPVKSQISQIPRQRRTFWRTIGWMPVPSWPPPA